MARTTIPEKPILQWSHSIQDDYEACLRKFWYGRYVAWQGWSTGSRSTDPLASRAYFLNKRTGIAGWVGSNVHQGISEVLQNKTSRGDVVSRVHNIMRNGWEESLRWAEEYKSSGVPPSELRASSVFLQEHYKGECFEESYLHDALDKAEDCLDTFLFSESIQRIQNEYQKAQNEGRFVANEHNVPAENPFEYRSFLRPVTVERQGQIEEVVVKINAFFDCMYEWEPGKFRIIDWKTGRPPTNEKDIEKNMEQLQLYACWALDRHDARPGHGPVQEIDATLVYLSSGEMFGGVVSSEEIAKRDLRVTELSSELAELHCKIEESPQDDYHGESLIEAMPKPMRCKWCNFVDMCPHAELEDA